MVRRLRTLTILCLAFSLAPAALAGETTSEATGRKPILKKLAGLRDRWVSAMDEFYVPGLAVVVVKDDEVIYLDTFGYRDLEKKLPVTPDTQFYIASATKPFTAMGIMTLVEKGKLKLSDPVKKYLPRMELPDAELTKTLTIHDLMCHAQGITCNPIVFLDAYTGEINEDRYYHFLKKNCEIKGSTEYTNVHYTLLGRVIESVTGQSWRDYLEEAIFKPAGMTRTTGYADRMYAGTDYASPYEFGTEGLEPTTHRKNDNTMHAAGGLGTSISDLARWLRLCMNGGEIDGHRIISASSAADMVKQHSDVRPIGRIRVMKGHGLAWFIGNFMPDGPAYVQHNGGYLGAGAHVSFLPEKKIGVAVVINAGAPGALFADQLVSVDLYKTLLDVKVPDLLPILRTELSKRLPSEKSKVAKLAAEIESANAEELQLPQEKYCGTYSNKWFGTLKISTCKDGLKFRLGAMELRPTKFDRNDFTALIGDSTNEGSFVVVNGRVKAVVLKLEEGPVRFKRI